MADSTHNITIKATLDTSSMQGQISSPSNNGQSSTANSAQTQAIKQFSTAAMQMALQVATIQSLLHSASAVVTQVTQGFDLISRQLGTLQQSFAVLHPKLREMTDIMSEYTTAARDTLEKLDELFETTATKVSDAAEKLVDGFDEASEAAQKNADANKDASKKLDIGFGKLSQALIGLMSLNQLTSLLGRTDKVLGGNTGFGMVSEASNITTSVISGALIGAKAGSIVPGLGTAVGTGAGAVLGATMSELTHALDEAEKMQKADLQNEQEAKEALARFKKFSENMHDIQDQIKQNLHAEEIANTATEDLDSKIEELTNNIKTMSSSLKLLNDEFIAGKIKISEYDKKLKDMQKQSTALEAEKQLLSMLEERKKTIEDQNLAELRQRTINFDYLQGIMQRQGFLKKEIPALDTMKYGTLDEVLQELQNWGKSNVDQQETSKQLMQKMIEANLAGDQPGFEEARRNFEEAQKNLEFGLKMRSGFATALQDIYKEANTYKGLNMQDFGQLAALGGFGSTSVMNDPILDLQREQNNLLSQMLQAIKDQDNSAKYLQ